MEVEELVTYKQEPSGDPVPKYLHLNFPRTRFLYDICSYCPPIYTCLHLCISSEIFASGF